MGLTFSRGNAASGGRRGRPVRAGSENKETNEARFMNKARNQKSRPLGDPLDSLASRFEYDRADEKRKIQEEIEDFLTEREQRKPPTQK